ncbi:MAG: DUF2786 domain-containing protein [Chlamydiae bacterium]|nr:DUF2786 domain-containing protein [Chlamydiota bacterium]
MKVYSRSLGLFVEEIKKIIKEILAKEIGVKVLRERFYDEDQKNSYPINIVIFDHKGALGYFHPQFYELGFHKRLLYVSKQILYSIIRHELAHYFVFIKYGGSEAPHGSFFQRFCASQGWKEDVMRASICVEDLEGSSEQEVSGILRKVQKLLALTTSHHRHEAELAFAKAQQLLLIHNMDMTQVSHDHEEEFVCQQILPSLRSTAKHDAIGRILRTFFVNVVHVSGRGIMHLEISGTRTNVEVAEYVASVLDHKLDKLWESAQGDNLHLRGITAKRSFFIGIAMGYCDRIQALKQTHKQEESRAVVVLEKHLEEIRDMIYPRLSRSRQGGRYCADSLALGQQAGQQLQIHAGIMRPPACTERYLSDQNS